MQLDGKQLIIDMPCAAIYSLAMLITAENQTEMNNEIKVMDV